MRRDIRHAMGELSERFDDGTHVTSVSSRGQDSRYYRGNLGNNNEGLGGDDRIASAEQRGDDRTASDPDEDLQDAGTGEAASSEKRGPRSTPMVDRVKRRILSCNHNATPKTKKAGVRVYKGLLDKEDGTVRDIVSSFSAETNSQDVIFRTVRMANDLKNASLSPDDDDSEK